jgi:hypothetical protein
MSCASLSRCVTCKTVIHTDLRNWLCALGGPDLFAPKSVRQGGRYGVRASPRQFPTGHPLRQKQRVDYHPAGWFSGQLCLSLSFEDSVEIPVPKPMLCNKLTAIVLGSQFCQPVVCELSFSLIQPMPARQHILIWRSLSRKEQIQTMPDARG